MAWECSDCNAREDDEVAVDAVCHHCGKPLCREHQVVVLLDDAFAPVGLKDPVLQNLFPVHCDSCGRAHHGQGLPK